MGDMGQMGGFIPSHGGYEELVTYQKALVIFQATFYLAQR